MSTAKAAEYVDAKSPEAFEQFVRRHHVPCVHYGRHRKFSAETLDRFMEMLAQRPASRPRLVRPA